jgi:hypothetical protein
LIIFVNPGFFLFTTDQTPRVISNNFLWCKLTERIRKTGYEKAIGSAGICQILVIISRIEQKLTKKRLYPKDTAVFETNAITSAECLNFLKPYQGGPAWCVLTDRVCSDDFFSLLMFMFTKFNACEETGVC